MTVFRGRILAALLVAAAAIAPPLSAQELNVVERTLPNGMKVLMVERHDQPTISCGWLARVGSANERPGITGLAHLFEHMMFKGTRTIGTKDAARDLELNRLQDEVQVGIREEMSILREKQRRGEIADMMDPAVRTPRLTELLAKFDALVTEQRGLIVKDEMDKLYQEQGSTGLNASTSEDRTFYIVGIPSNKLELWMWLESDRLANPVFREFYSERNVILEERRQTLESRPGGTVDEAFNAMTWMAHPYSWEVIGWPSDISQVTREQGSEFFATYYAPNNITAILVGDLDVEKTWALAQKYLGRIPANPKGVPEVITLEPTQPAEQRMVAEVERTPVRRGRLQGRPRGPQGRRGAAGPRRRPRRRADDGPPRDGRADAPALGPAPPVARPRQEGRDARLGLVPRPEVRRPFRRHRDAGPRQAARRGRASPLRRAREGREGGRHRRRALPRQERDPRRLVHPPREQLRDPRVALAGRERRHVQGPPRRPEEGRGRHPRGRRSASRSSTS